MGWWRPAAWSRLVMGRSRRGGPSAVTPVTASHVAAGRVTAVTASARRPGPLPLAISLTDRSLRDRRAIALLGTARLVRSSLPASAASLPTRPRRDSEIASSIQKSSGPRGHTFLLLGSSRHAAIGARLVTWRQPGGWGMKSLIASTAPFRPEPDVLASAAALSGGGAGLGRDRTRADAVARWRALGRARDEGPRCWEVGWSLPAR